MSQPEDDNNWNEWSRFVLAELKRLSEVIHDLDEKIDRIKDDHIQPLKIDNAKLNVKAGVWGVLGGAIPVIIMVLIELLKKTSTGG